MTLLEKPNSVANCNEPKISHINPQQMCDDAADSAFTHNKVVSQVNGLTKVMLILCFMIAGKRYHGHSVATVDEAWQFKETVEKTFVLMDTAIVSDYLMQWK